jgi:hypothetical protein
MAEFRVALKRCSIGLVLARLGEGSQLSLCVTPEEWTKIRVRREALGFVVK